MAEGGDPTLLSAAVGANAQLLDLRLRHAAFELHLDELSEEPLVLTSSIDVRWSRAEADDGTVAQFLVAFTVLAGRVDGPTEFEATVEHALAYQVAPGHSDEELEAFGQTTAVFASYPYLREMVQSLTGKAGLPPLVLPVWRSYIPGSDIVDREGTPLKPAAKPARPVTRTTASKGKSASTAKGTLKKATARKTAPRQRS